MNFWASLIKEALNKSIDSAELAERPGFLSAAGSRPACSRQARLYHPALAGTPPEEGNWNYLGGLFPTPLYHGSAELAERPASMQAYIRVGESALR